MLFIKITNKLQTIFQQAWNLLKFNSYSHQIQCGKNAIIKGTIYIRLRTTGRLVIGNDFRCFSGNCHNPIARNIRTSFCTEEHAVIEIGDNVGISSSCLWAFKKITIGNNVNIGADCVIIDSDAHSLNYEDRRNGDLDKQNRKSRPIVIGDDVLIGTRSIILKGVTIGARSIIGAGSVVTCNVPSDEIWAGNPARFVKKLTT